MNIFSKLDKRLRLYFRNQYLQSTAEADLKPHSFFAVGAVIVTDWVLSYGIQFEYWKDFMVLYRLVLVLFCLSLYVMTFYYWRILFNLREEGLNADKNLFFAESADLPRKVVFYIAFAQWLIMTIYSHFYKSDIGTRMAKLQYALRADYYREVGFAVIESIVFAILLVEILRTFIVKTFLWDNKLHFVIVAVVATLISAIRILGLKLASGHGIF